MTTEGARLTALAICCPRLVRDHTRQARFAGFDGNNESEHLGIDRFLIESLDRFSSFEGRDLDSQAPLIRMYRRMLSAFEPIRRTLTGGELTATSIIHIFKAKLHPDHRQRS